MKTKLPKINFIGNKEKLANWICDNIPKDVETIFDAFSGSSSISFEAKKRGYTVISNDILKSNYALALALVENKNIKLNQDDINLLFGGKPFEGFMTENYSNITFFRNECLQLDLFRENVNKLNNKYKRALALTLMRRAMIRKMPYSRFNLPWKKIIQLRDEEYSYSKYRRRRAYHNESFKKHFLDNLKQYNSAIFDNSKNNKVFNRDIFQIISKINTDLIYLDPPYTGTMNNYFSFYGLLDEYIDGEKKKPFKNNFVEKKESLTLFDKLFSQLGKYKYWMLSCNNSSYPSKEELLNLIRKYSNDITILQKKHNYQLTGKGMKSKNQEYLFIVKNK